MAVIGTETYIENRTFDEINVGVSESLVRTLTREDIELFAVMSGDVNPAHLDEEYARNDQFQQVIAHGMWGASLISTLLGTLLPGPGTVYLEQTLRFRRPVCVGDTVTVSVTATEKDEERHRVTLDCQCVNQNGKSVINGTAVVLAPTEKVRRPRISLPEVQLHKHGVFFRDLIARAEGLEPIRTAVAHPVDAESLTGVVGAAQAGLIVPVLVGPEERIRAAADAAELDISDFAVADAEHSHAAAVAAVGMARMGAVQAVMNGSLHPLELVSAAVVSQSHVRSDRRMSHVVVLDVPGYSRPLFVTDTALNVEPSLDDKRDIVQNAIDLTRAMGVERPSVAILSATGTVNPKVRSTLDAAALTKMADRGQIAGGVVDGPLAFSDAVSVAGMTANGQPSPVAGRADVLVVPDLEAGTMLVEQLVRFGDAQGVGVVLGGRVPIVIAGNAASPLERLTSCALAVCLVRRGERQKLRR